MQWYANVVVHLKMPTGSSGIVQFWMINPDHFHPGVCMHDGNRIILHNTVFFAKKFIGEKLH